ncbi:MAG: GNAT family N-acetyltransferase, partial [Armatimonadetes bacterium]|nr:GNAT family N-acetyltransferase [Armatimonadota bacterium]
MTRIRTAQAEDAEGVGQVIGEAFGETYRETTVTECRHVPGQWRVLEHGGRIVSACRVQVHRLQVGRCEISKGDVGHMGTLPEAQGRGFASELMLDTIGYLREAGCQIGRLGGLIEFYSRFGWVPFPRRYYEFRLEPAKAGVRTLQPDEYLLPSGGFGGRVVPFDPVQHHNERARLHEAFNRERTGAPVTTFGPPPREGWPDTTGLRLACELEGRLVGYLFGFQRPARHTSFEAEAEIGEVAFEWDHPEALGALVMQALGTAYQRGATRVTGRLPFDVRVEDALRSCGVPFFQVEIQTAPASNMIRIVDLLGLLRQIAPELEARLARSAAPDWTGEVAFCVDERTAVLEVRNGTVAVWEWTPGEHRVGVDQATLLKLVLGLRSFGECAQLADRQAHAVCETLFPR